jgi:hypothetical protein
VHAPSNPPPEAARPHTDVWNSGVKCCQFDCLLTILDLLSDTISNGERRSNCCCPSRRCTLHINSIQKITTILNLLLIFLSLCYLNARSAAGEASHKQMRILSILSHFLFSFPSFCSNFYFGLATFAVRIRRVAF